MHCYYTIYNNNLTPPSRPPTTLTPTKHYSTKHYYSIEAEQTIESFQ